MRVTKRTEIIFLVVVLSILILSMTTLVTTVIVSKAAPTATPTITFTVTPSLTLTSTRLPTSTATATFTSTTTFTPTRTPTLTFTPSITPTPSNTPTAFIFDQGLFQRKYVLDQIIPGIINRMLVAEDGAFWFASPYAVGRYDAVSRQFTQVNLRDPVVALTQDGKAWILPASGSPLQFWDGNSNQEYYQSNGWIPPQGYGAPSPKEPTFSTDQNGNWWLTTAYDVRRLRGNQWQIFTPQILGFDLPYRKTISTSFVLANSKISDRTWVGSCNWSGDQRLDGEGIRQFDGTAWSKSAMPATPGCVTALAASADGNLWVGMDGLLWRYSEQKDQWLVFEPPPLDEQLTPGFRHGAVLDITIAPDHSAWVLYELCGSAGCQTRQIRYHILKEEWTSIRLSSQIRPPLLLFDKDSTAWLFSPNEISRLEGDQLKPVAWIDWLQAASDEEGRIWVLSGELNARMILWVNGE